VLTISRRTISLNDAPIFAALRGRDRFVEEDGIGVRFSAGFRSCLYGDQQFTFTDKQALAVEALYDNWKQGLSGLTQVELKAAASTNQRMAQLFAAHPAYRTLIKHGGSGRYWLDI
jgi:hypothetical protein